MRYKNSCPECGRYLGPDENGTRWFTRAQERGIVGTIAAVVSTVVTVVLTHTEIIKYISGWFW